MDTDEKQAAGRPNESLPLSGDQGGGEGPVFYYSRSRRLSRAPAKVRALYEEKARPKFNLFRPLLSTRANTILFGTMAALLLISLVISFSGLGNRTGDYYGNQISVQAVRYDGSAVVVLKKNRREGGAAYTGPLEITVSPEESSLTAESGAPYLYRLHLSSRTSEEFSFSVPFEEPRLVVGISHAGAGEGGGLVFRIKTK
jgi:hypothetical protein